MSTEKGGSLVRLAHAGTSWPCTPVLQDFYGAHQTQGNVPLPGQYVASTKLQRSLYHLSTQSIPKKIRKPHDSCQPITLYQGSRTSCHHVATATTSWKKPRPFLLEQLREPKLTHTYRE